VDLTLNSNWLSHRDVLRIASYMNAGKFMVELNSVRFTNETKAY